MKELLTILFIVWAPQVHSIDIEKMKQRLINKVETKAKRYKIFQDLSKATNIHTDYGSLRIRPNNIRFEKKFDNKHLKIETNGKDSVKANFNFSF